MRLAPTRLAAQALVQDLAHARPEVRRVQQDVAFHLNVEETHAGGLLGCDGGAGRGAACGRDGGGPARARRAGSAEQGAGR